MAESAEVRNPGLNPEAARDARRENLRREIEEFKEAKGTLDPIREGITIEKITNEVTQELADESDRAEIVANLQDNEQNPEKGKVPPNAVPYARSMQNGVQLFIEAASEGLIKKPEHKPTRQVFDALVIKLKANPPNLDTAAFLQPLLLKLATTPNYVTFSEDGSAEPTQFEKDLIKFVSVAGRNKVEEHLEEIIGGVGGDIGITLEKFKEKKEQARAERIELVRQAAQEEQENIRREQERAMDGYGNSKEHRDRSVRELILEGIDIAQLQRDPSLDTAEIRDVRDALILFDNLNSPQTFFTYYQGLHERTYQKILTEGRGGATEEARRKRAGKEATRRIHELLMFMTHKIFSPVIESSGEDAWERLAGKKSRNYMMSLEMAFENLMGKFDDMKMGVSDRNPLGADMPHIHFYKYGNMSEGKWEEWAQQEGGERVDPKTGKSTVVGGKFIEYTTPSPELIETDSFKEMLDDLYLSGRAEHDFLISGTNFNFLMNKGIQGQQNTTFFKQAAGYAKETLQSHRLDELYKLPYAELIEAAKIQISGYYKKKFAAARWIKNPEILQGFFKSLNEAEDEALKDMVVSYGDVPEWAIRRAIIHARMHLSLVNLEMHAISSYANAPVDELGGATYRDPALKDLEIFDTWYAATQWQVSDAFIKGMAFLPQPDGTWKKEKWVWQDIRDEGIDIYREAFQLGKLSRYGRKEYTPDMAPNIQERNPMGAGGVETRLGWRMKYAIFPWLRDMLDNLNDANKLNPEADKDGRTLEYAWKRIENIGINPMKILRDDLLFDGDFVKMKDGHAVREQEYKHLFRFLYDRYFSAGVGKEGMSLDFQGKNREQQSVQYKDIQNADEFWQKVVEPILNRKRLGGSGGPSASVLEKQNQIERVADLKRIVDQALGVMAFERAPMDFAFVESPVRSQNGVTLYNELEVFFQKGWEPIKGLSSQEKNKIRDDAFDDVLFVQQRARIESARRMNDFVIEQADASGQNFQKTVYGKDLDSLKQDRSDIEIYQGQVKKGYLVDHGMIRHFLEEKYKFADIEDPAKRQAVQLKIDAALEVYTQLEKRVKIKPDKNEHELNPTITDTRRKMALRQRGIKWDSLSKGEQKAFDESLKADLIREFQRAREEDMQTRLMWSTGELIGNEAAMPINDTAYQFMEFKRAGRDMVQRTVQAIADTQEAYKAVVGGGQLVSALKKYYRKEDTETLHKLLVDMRSSIKEEDESWATAMEMRVLENAINVMRINTDAENPIIEGQYVAQHKDRAAFSTVVKEGPQYPLRREDRNKILKDYLHYAQLPKRVKAEEEVYELISRQEKWGENYTIIGEFIGKIADTLAGDEDGILVRRKWKELSGEGIRDRQVASYVNLLRHEGLKYVVLAALAIVILGMIKGFKDAEAS